MIRVFVDASVLIAAAYSATGAARDLAKLAIEGRVILILSQDILDEVQRNILKKMPYLRADYETLLESIAPEMVNDPTPAAVQEAATYVNVKDAHVVAAAIAAQPDYLVTYDQKHLLNVPTVATQSGLTIVTPDIVVKAVLDEDPGETSPSDAQ